MPKRGPPVIASLGQRFGWSARQRACADCHGWTRVVCGIAAQDSAGSLIADGLAGSDPVSQGGRHDVGRPATVAVDGASKGGYVPECASNAPPPFVTEVSGGRARQARRWRRVGMALAVLGAAFVLVATLTPVRDVRGLAPATPILCLVCGENGGADGRGQPAALPSARGRTSALRPVVGTAPCSCAASSPSKSVAPVPGRGPAATASLSDVLTNTTSGRHRRHPGRPCPLAWWRRARGKRRCFSPVGSALLLFFLGASAWLLGPVGA